MRVRAVKVMQIYERLRADNWFTSCKVGFVILGYNNTFDLTFFLCIHWRHLLVSC